MSSPILETAALAVGYGGSPVVSGVSVTLGSGTLWAVLGPNGSGKSTLLRTVLGLLRPIQGEVRVFGTPVGRWERRALARLVAWVPQSFDGDPGFTGLELVLMGRAPHLRGWGLPGPKDLAVARAVLAELGIGHLAGRIVSRLSGGERRLLLVARALAQEPAPPAGGGAPRPRGARRCARPGARRRARPARRARPRGPWALEVPSRAGAAPGPSGPARAR